MDRWLRTGTLMLLGFGALLLAGSMGCASGDDLAGLPAHHPANPEVAETPFVPPPLLSAEHGSSDSGTTETGSADGSDHSGHGSAKTDDPGGKAGAGPDTAAAVYTCPMHPQVQTTEPGVCPLCNMKLVPQPRDKDHTGEER